MGGPAPGEWDVVIVYSRGQATTIFGGSQWDGYCRYLSFQPETCPHSGNAPFIGTYLPKQHNLALLLECGFLLSAIRHSKDRSNPTLKWAEYSI
jgi:hypothetical protein